MNEILIHGRAVSRGNAIGRIVCIFGTKRQFVKRTPSESNAEIELERFEVALMATAEKIEQEVSVAIREQNKAASEILISHRTILEDPSIRRQITDRIRNEGINAEWAVYSIFENTAARFIAQSDERLKEKHLDIEDVCESILSCLGVENMSIELPPNSIIAAKEISPAMFLDLAAKGMIGLIAENGGWTSHTSILAREAKIPAITGVDRVLETFANDILVGLDGFSGEISINPSDQSISRFEHPDSSLLEPFDIEFVDKENLSTLDCRDIILKTNTGTVSSYQRASNEGAKGIGLFRSEVIIDTFGRIPNEDEQTKYYSDLARATGDDGIRIRTFDIDESILDHKVSVRQKNPALGLRAIRLGFAREELLRTQIRALLRAAKDTNLSVVVPMVSGTTEIEKVRQIIEEESLDLELSKTEFGHIEIGAMIEIPSAVLVVDQLLTVCDFLCLGTNDLAQYLFAADRDNQAVAKWFRTLHPAMIRSVQRVIDECNKAQKPLTVCGEMAGSPFYVPVLIGLGATELSMSPSSIPPVSRVIAGIAYDEAVGLVQKINNFDSADEIEEFVRTVAKREWSHLYSKGFLDMHTS